MTKTLTGLAIALALLAFTSPATAQQAAQATDEDGQFYLDLAGSAVFPYEPKTPSGLGFKAGAGFTAAFGYAFKEGFSTEIELGYQKVGIGDPSGGTTFGGGIGTVVPFVVFPDLGADWTNSQSFQPFPTTVKIDGEIKTPSLMGNFYYRYPKWRVSPYVGFGLGAFFHDRTVTSTIILERPPGFGFEDDPVLTGFILGLPVRPLTTTATYEDSRFAYQIMAGLLVRATKRVEFRFGYRFRSSRGAPIDADQIEAGIRFRFR